MEILIWKNCNQYDMECSLKLKHVDLVVLESGRGLKRDLCAI